VVARCDGQPIRWPVHTHGPGRPRPHRTVAECIDWSIGVPSIFDRKRPLADATCRRIATGIVRYVLEAAEPFIVSIDNQSSGDAAVRRATQPLSTITSKARHAVVAPTLVHTGNGERAGQAPRVYDIRKPLGTVVAGGQKHALVAAWLAKHYGGMVGHGLQRPLGTITATDHHSLVTTPIAPLSEAVVERGRRVAAFITAYYGTGIGQDLRAPLRTIPTVDRFGLVTVDLEGEPWALVDVGLRMLEPHELLAAQFGPERAATYVLTGTKRNQVARIGNSVCPDAIRAVVSAQLAPISGEAAA
jgi:DNA (cytosine-5)-methyltransferase 1